MGRGQSGEGDQAAPERHRRALLAPLLVGGGLGLLVLLGLSWASPQPRERTELGAGGAEVPNGAPPPRGSVAAEPHRLVERGPSPRADAEPGGSEAMGPVPMETEPETPPLTRRHLDRMPRSEAQAVLRVAAREALETRGLFVPPGLIDTLGERETVPLILGRADAERVLPGLLEGANHRTLRHYQSIPFAAVEVGPEALRRLIEEEGVRSIEADVVARSTMGLESDDSAHAQQLSSVDLIGAQPAIDAGFDGSDWTIVVVDSGVDTSHSYFAARLITGYCFSRSALCPDGSREMTDTVEAGRSCSIQGCEHGTLVAGIALGNDSVRNGVAPESGLISMMVSSRDSDGHGESVYAVSDILAALDQVHAIRGRHPMASVNLSMSWGKYESQSDCASRNPAVRTAVERLRSVGIPVVASSGNGGHSDAIGAPACLDDVLSVGASTYDDEVAGFSNAASFLDLLAPGQQVFTSREGGGYALFTGTSAAAPHVAGALAVIRSAHPGASVDELDVALSLSGVPIKDSRSGETIPRIDVSGAIDAFGEYDLAAEIARRASVEEEAKACGLIGPEVLLPLLLGRRTRRRR